MILYHGTSYSNGKKIIEEGVIKKNIERVFSKTEDGFIYLTPSLSFASYWGNGKSIINDEECFYLFRVNLDNNTLLKDHDEEKIVEFWGKNFSNLNLEDSMKKTLSTRIDYDLQKDKYSIEFVTMSNMTIGCKILREIISLYRIEKEEDISYEQKKYIEKTVERFNRSLKWIRL